MVVGDSQQVLEQALQWRRARLGVALATVVKTWGSSPRQAGSQLAVNDRGDMVGSVSGGCVEAAVVQESAQVIAEGTPRNLEFGVTNETAWEVGLACGGRIRVFVERVPAEPAALEAVRAAHTEKRPVVLVTDLASGEQQLVYPQDTAGQGADAELATAAAEAARRDRSSVFAAGDRELFLHVHNPPLRLIIIGGVHIAQPLSRIAARSGFEVTVVDPRAAFLTEARFPDVARVVAWPDRAFAALQLDRRTAVVTLTHDPKIDEPALAAALRSEVFYIGALGSTRTQAKRLQRLRAAGFDDATLGRICGPVGLDIGAESTSEIAVAIAAQLIETLRREAV